TGRHPCMQPTTRTIWSCAASLIASIACIRNFVTKDLAVIEPSTRRIVKNINYWYWTGHDVLLNCRKHENRYIDLAYCDERTGERFFFGPREDWSPPNWLVDLEESEGSSR